MVPRCAQGVPLGELALHFFGNLIPLPFGVSVLISSRNSPLPCSPAKLLWCSEQNPVPVPGHCHLPCPSLEDTIKAAWPLCQLPGSQGLCGQKLWKMHFSDSCIKNIWLENALSARDVPCLHFPFPSWLYEQQCLVLFLCGEEIRRSFNCTELHPFVRPSLHLKHLQNLYNCSGLRMEGA